MSDNTTPDTAPADPSIENVSLKRQLELAQAEILRLQNLAFNLEITVRTLASMAPAAQMVQPQRPAA